MFCLLGIARDILDLARHVPVNSHARLRPRRAAADLNQHVDLPARVLLVGEEVHPVHFSRAEEIRRPMTLLAIAPYRTQRGHGNRNRPRIIVLNRLHEFRHAANLRFDVPVAPGPTWHCAHATCACGDSW